MKRLEILKAAKELIADGTRWTRGVMAVGRDGYSTLPTDPNAVKFCAIGALSAVAGSQEQGRDIARSMYYHGHSLMSINDGCGHEAVMAAFDRAIERETRSEAARKERAQLVQV